MKDFAVSESKALSVSSSGHLTIDKKAAKAQRFRVKTTWIFDRLYDMAQSSIPIEVWDTYGGLDAVGQEGADYKGWDWHGKNDSDQDEPLPGTKATRIWVMQRNPDVLNRDGKYTVKARLRRGEIYVHELVVHAAKRYGGWMRKTTAAAPSRRAYPWACSRN